MSDHDLHRANARRTRDRWHWGTRWIAVQRYEVLVLFGGGMFAGISVAGILMSLGVRWLP